MYFQTSVRYDKMHENGTVAKTTEKYLFHALTFTEAESRTIEEITPYISGEFTVSSAKKTRIAEVLDPDADCFWLAKTAMTVIDEKTATEKKTPVLTLVGAPGFHEALAAFQTHMKGTASDWELQSLSLTDIISVFPDKKSQSQSKVP